MNGTKSGESSKSATANGTDHGDESDGEDDDDDMDAEDDSGTLLTTMPSFNSLLLVLRDQHVMRFVKYVSAAAAGSRWDVCGEYEVGKVEEVNSSEDD